MWIEISYALKYEVFLIVTPLAGVWIEINTIAEIERGNFVTPLAGVWIEIAGYQC